MVGLVHSLGYMPAGAVNITRLNNGLCMNLFTAICAWIHNKEINGDQDWRIIAHLQVADIYAQTPASQRADKAIVTILPCVTAIRPRKLPRTLRETGKDGRKHETDEVDGESVKWWFYHLQSKRRPIRRTS